MPILVIFTTILSFLGTCRIENTNCAHLNFIFSHLKFKQAFILLLPALASLRLLNDNEQNVAQMIFYLPFFLVANLILSDWLEFLGASLILTAVAKYFESDYVMIAPLLKCLGVYTLIFACYEKQRKEQFIISHTNAKTKKTLLGLLNQTSSPIAIVSGSQPHSSSSLNLPGTGQAGQILYCNIQFEKMLNERLGQQVIPQNIMHLIKDDEESINRFKAVLHSSGAKKVNSNIKSSQNEGSPSFMGTMNQVESGNNNQQSANSINREKFEVRLSKKYIPKKKENNNQAPCQKNSKEETKSGQGSLGFCVPQNANGLTQKFQTIKDIFDHYEIAMVKADQVHFQHASRSVMLTFNLITEQKAKNQLLYVNSQMLHKSLTQFNKRLQQLYHQAQSSQENINRQGQIFNGLQSIVSEENFGSAQQQSIIEFLGTTYLALNKIQQIAYEFQEAALSQQTGEGHNEENFLLKEEILQSVESLSAKCLSQNASIKLDTKYLPEKLQGDITKFRLSLHSVVEFALTYCKEGVIDICVTFAGMTAKNQYLIQFDFVFNRNKVFNEEPIVRLLNSLSSGLNSGQAQSVHSEELLLKNYEDFFGLIQHFGMGMIIFPNLIHDLGGSYTIQFIGENNNIKVSQNSNEEQDKAPTVQIGGASGGGILSQDVNNHSQMSSGFMKIQFKVPFKHAELSKKVINPYFPFNPNKEDVNGKQIIKSPMLKTRESRRQVMNDMKRLMDENSKSPLFSARKQTFKGPGGSQAGNSMTRPLGFSGHSDSLTAAALGGVGGAPALQRILPYSNDQASKLIMQSANQGSSPSNFRTDNLSQKNHSSIQSIQPPTTPCLPLNYEESKGEMGTNQQVQNTSSTHNIEPATHIQAMKPKASPMKKSSSQLLLLDTESSKKNRNLIKRVENTLKNFEMKTGSMNNQEFFKNNTKMQILGATGGSGSSQKSLEEIHSQITMGKKPFASMNIEHSQSNNDSLINNKDSKSGHRFKSSPGIQAEGIGGRGEEALMSQHQQEKNENFSDFHKSSEKNKKKPSQSAFSSDQSNDAQSNQVARVSSSFFKGSSGTYGAPNNGGSLNASSIIDHNLNSSGSQAMNPGSKRNSYKEPLTGSNYVATQGTNPYRKTSLFGKNAVKQKQCQNRLGVHSESQTMRNPNSREHHHRVNSDSSFTSSRFSDDDQVQTSKLERSREQNNINNHGEISSQNDMRERAPATKRNSSFMLRANREVNPFSVEMNDQSFAEGVGGDGGGANGSGENNENRNMLMDSQSQQNKRTPTLSIGGGDEGNPNSSTLQRELISFGGFGGQGGGAVNSRGGSDKFITHDHQSFGSSLSRGIRNIQGVEEEETKQQQQMQPHSRGSRMQVIIDSPEHLQQQSANQIRSLNQDGAFQVEELKQFDNENEEYYNENYEEEEEEEEKLEPLASNERMSRFQNSMPLSRHLLNWVQDNLSVSGNGASKGVLTTSPNSQKFSYRQGVQITQSPERVRNTMGHMPPSPFNQTSNVHHRFQDLEQTSEFNTTGRKTIPFQVPTSRRGTQQNASLGYLKSLVQPSTTNNSFNQLRKTTLPSQHQQTWVMQGGDTQLQQVLPQRFDNYNEVMAPLSLHRLQHESSQLEESKMVHSSIRCRQYKKSEKTIRQQEKLKILDQQGGGALKVWDRKLLKSIEEAKRQQADEVKRLAVQSQLPPGARNSKQSKGAKHSNGCSIDTSKRYVLVVEDNTMISMILEELLKKMKYEAILAENGQLGVDKFRSFIREGVTFDLIIMDILMPVMGGYQATQTIRKIEEEFRLSPSEKHFICGFSAEVNQEIIKKCKDAGMNEMVPKPMSANALQELIARNPRTTNIISKKEKEQENQEPMDQDEI